MYLLLVYVYVRGTLPVYIYKASSARLFQGCGCSLLSLIVLLARVVASLSKITPQFIQTLEVQLERLPRQRCEVSEGTFTVLLFLEHSLHVLV